MASTAHRAEAVGFLFAASFGVLFYFVWAGWRFLDPQNVGWLRVGDRAMHTIGWFFYRVTPWSWPPGLNPRNGIEVSSSVALSDSLPLFAVPFKLLSPLLPTVFQYWGLWFLTSMILMAVFGYAIGRELNLSRPVSVALGALMVLTPAFLWRMPVHMALAGHWVLLAAIWLYVKRVPPRRFAWPLLVAVTSAVHAYLLAMVIAIWGAALVERLWTKRMRWMSAALEAALGVGAMLVVMWSVGFFVTSSLGAPGFGLYRMNLDSFLDSNNWSWIVPNLPSADGDYEGAIYPGLGVLILLVLGLALGFRRLRGIVSPRWLPLFIVALALAIFAVSDRPTFGTTVLGTIPLPQQLLNFFSMFRASGRMVWPAGYLVVLLGFVLLGNRLPARALAVLAVVAVAVQAVDTSRGWAKFAATQPGPSASWPTPLRSSFWAIAAQHYKRIRTIPVSGMHHYWAELSYFAAFHGMASDATYLGRLDARAFTALKAKAARALSAGTFDPEALYVLDGAAAAAAQRWVEAGDLLSTVDGLIVFARGGRRYADIAALGMPAYQAPTMVVAGEPVRRD